MTLRKALAFFILLALSFLPNASSAAGFEEPRVEYSADSYFESEGASIKSKVSHAPGKERREMEGMVMIVRRDKKVVWQLMPEMKKYMENPIGKDDKKSDISDYKIEQTIVGPDVVEGMNTTKYKVVMTDKSGDRYTGLMWSTKDGIMVKLDAEGEHKGRKAKMKNYLRNIKIARQDPKLFEIPAGYTSMGSVMDMFKGAQEESQKAQEEAARKAKEAEAKKAKEEAARKKAEEERDYTASERDYTSGERDYTSSPRKKTTSTSTSTGAAPSASDTAKDTAKKLWKLFGK